MDIIEQLSKFEGRVPHAYQDHLGYWTIGVGILVDKKKGGGLREEEIDYLLTNRLRLLREGLDKAIPWWRDLNEPRQAVLLGMAYQMGLDGMLAFTRTLGHIRAGRPAEAATSMRESLWAKQTPSRALKLAVQMETGEWVDPEGHVA